jgi:hypothetical protein
MMVARWNLLLTTMLDILSLLEESSSVNEKISSIILLPVALRAWL